MTIDGARLERISYLHDELQSYLRQYQPHTPVVDIVTALTFEIGRLVAQSDAPVDELVDAVAATMRDQIRAHREGRLRP